MSLDFSQRIRRGLRHLLFQAEAAMINFEQAKLLYLNATNSAKVSAQEKSGAWVKLETVEQHLLLFKP
ncbi:hypothetical protein [Synechocystis sp. PCC 7509]|uniref:hypothetical protein n=1 Tax=Synechocystis sp. PCC 7509 TaxID=927677 RepID=UPI0002AC54B8|nr:hypothetical protein [Synechocystis sp. PCC 7509]